MPNFGSWVLAGIAVVGLSAGMVWAADTGVGKADTAKAAPAAGKPVNLRCPIMGGAIDADHIKPELTRQFKGMTIGFCCPICPPQWDKLTDAEKQAKLDAVMNDQDKAQK